VAEARVPSPFLGLGHLLRLRGDQLAFYADMQSRHGDAVPLRLGPYRSWLLFHPDAIEGVLATRAAAFIRFEPVMQVLAQWNGASLLVSEGERWRARRRQVLPAFAQRRLPGYGDRIVARTLAWLDALEAAPGDAPLLDTDREMAALTLDLAADTLFGERLGDRAGAIGEAVATLSEVAFRESTAPLRLPDWLPTPLARRKRRAVGAMDALVRGIVTARLARPEDDRGDLLSILAEGGAADPVAVRDEVMTLLIAGHETTGALLSWTLDLLARHGAVLAAVRAEIGLAAGSRAPRADDLRAMPLLRAVIEEALRLYPPAYALFPRRATEDVTVGGVALRRGDLAVVVPWVTQRDPRWFDEPTAFRPGRFLADSGWPRYAYVPFGAGPRVCVGAAFGMLEAGLVLATLLQRVTPTSVSDAPAVPEARFSLRPRGGLPQRWHIRSADG